MQKALQQKFEIPALLQGGCMCLVSPVNNSEWMDDDGKISYTISSPELTFGSAELKIVSLCKTPLPYIALRHTLPLFYPTPCMPSPYSIPPHGWPPPILSTQPMHALPLFYPSSCMPSPYYIPACAHPPPILSHSMHVLPLFYPSLCTPSPYSIPAHAHPPPIGSQPMHTLPLFYPNPCMSSHNSIPAHTHPPSIIFHPMHALSIFFPTLCVIFSCSLPAHACPPNSMSHTPWRHISPLTSEYATFESAHTEYIIIIYLA